MQNLSNFWLATDDHTAKTTIDSKNVEKDRVESKISDQAKNLLS
jgi:hypothetical protein